MASISRVRTAALASLAIGSLAARVGAQEPVQPPARDTVPAVELAPVTVEVFRTPTELRRVPFGVTTVGGPGLREGRSGLSIDDAVRSVPGVQVDNRYNYALGERVSIRGFGARTQFGVRGIRILVDGLPVTFADGQSALEIIDPGSIERVEVIRGPASALFGNASGGVILFRTRTPPPVPVRQELRAVSGDNGLLRLESRTAGQMNGTSYQVQLSRLAYDGYREYSAYETWQGSALLQRSVGAGDLRLSANFVDFTAENPGSLSRALMEQDRNQAFPNNVLQRTGKEGRQAQVGAVLLQPLGVTELEVSGHVQRRDITNPIPNRIIELDRSSTAVRALVRGEAPLGGTRLAWTVGTDVDAQWDDRENFINVEGERGDLALDQSERVLGVGAFAQLLVPLATTLSVMGALRADRFDFRVDDRFVTETDPDDSGTRTMSAVSPSVGLMWNAMPALDLYANLSTVFETPTTTELANRPDGAGGFNPELEPQYARSIEVGARGGSRGVSYHAALYRSRIRNALIPFQVPEVQGRDFFRNAGTAIHRGAEAMLGVALPAGFSATAGYTYVDAVFDDYTVRGESFAGNRVPGVAPHRWTGALSYRRDGGVFAGLDLQRVSSIPVDDANSDAAPAYSLLGARVGHSGVRVGRAEVAPFVGVNNLLDEDYVTAVTINAFGGRFFEPGPNRSLYLGMEVRGGGVR